MRLAAFAGSSLLLACAAPRAPSDVQPLLAPGPHPVGFEITWAFDPSRSYRTTFDQGAAYGGPAEGLGASRPILVSLWYPAARDGERMPRAAYLPPFGDARTVTLASALARYQRDVIAGEVFGAPEAELAPELHAAFEAYLARPTGSVLGAPPAHGAFPLVLHHSGAGSSTEDNAEFCEHLASRGFVVASAPFQLEDGSGFNVDCRAASAADLEFLAGWTRARPFVAHGRVGAVGHSAGAQALLRFAARRPSTSAGVAVDALVLLDTTQDYNSTLDTRWSFVEAVRSGRDEVRETLLFATDPHAFFELADELDGAERGYLTVSGLEHNDYIAQGIAAARERARREPTPENVTSARLLEARYRALCSAVATFLAAELLDSGSARAALARLEENPLNGASPRLERMPRGARTPPAYDEDANAAPSPRQLRAVLAARGAAATAELLARFRTRDRANPVYTESWFAYALLFELVQRGRPDDARVLYAFFRELHPDLIESILSQIEAFTRFGYRDYSRAALATGLVLEPDLPAWEPWREELAPE